MILIAFLISLNFAFAVPDYCRYEAHAKVEKRIPLDSDINYFVRSSISDQRISFATSQGNTILDLVTNEKIKVEGKIDPVLSPDGDLMIYPAAYVIDPATGRKKNVTDQSGPPPAPYALIGSSVFKVQHNKNTGSTEHIRSDLSLERLNKMRLPYIIGGMAVHTKNPISGHYETKIDDTSVPGNYQSIGILSESSVSKRYRMIYEGLDGFFFREYDLDKKSRTVTPIGSPVSICGNQEVLGSLPMISRRGDEFSLYFPDEEKTKILSINRMNGTCSVTDTIPAMTGKIDFSPSGQRVAFHMDQNTDSLEHFSAPHDASQLGVFIYDRKTKSLIPVEDKPDEDSYYPVFLDEDRIAFASATKPPDRKFFLNVVTVENSALSCAACDANSKRGQLAALLGRIYNQKCAAPNAGFKQSLTGYSKLTREHCHAMLKDTSSEEFESIRFAPNLVGKQWRWELLKDVTLADLEPACETETAPITGSTGTVK